MAKKTKQTRCPDCKRVGRRLKLPCGHTLRVHKGELEISSCSVHFYPQLEWDPDLYDCSSGYEPCPPKTTLQVWKWLGEQLGYEIED